MYIHEIQKFTLTFAAAIAEAATTIMTTNFLWKQDNKNILGFFMTRAKKKLQQKQLLYTWKNVAKTQNRKSVNVASTAAKQIHFCVCAYF